MPELKPSFAIDVFPNPNLPQPNIPAKSLWNARGKFFPCTPPHPWHCHYSFDVFLTLKVASYSYLLRQCSWGQQAVFEPCHRSKNKTSGSIQLSGPKQLMTQCKNEARILCEASQVGKNAFVLLNFWKLRYTAFQPCITLGGDAI